MLNNSREPIFLVINADDYGYFSCISRGIIDCVSKGAVSATALMSNGPQFIKLSKWLRNVPDCDIGAHLNITYGHPITEQFQRKLTSTNGRFADKLTTASLLIQRKLTVEDVKAEWQAQIERILDVGFRIRFLNSHEHIHIMPTLATLMQELAKKYRINRIRNPSPEWKNHPIGFNGVLRNILMWIAIRSSGSYRKTDGPPVIGIAVSGKLTLNYLRRCFKTLRPGKTYELMCHPGFYDPEEIMDHRLRKFHAWEQEMYLLTSDAMKALMRHYKIQIRRFSEL
jgi:predicted glycoside hydrolase/deacetylase ChbG (UPF0249 family)